MLWIWTCVRLVLCLSQSSVTTDPRNRRERSMVLLKLEQASMAHVFWNARLRPASLLWYATLYRYGREISHRGRLAADRSPWIAWSLQAGASRDLVLRRPRRLSLTAQGAWSRLWDPAF